MDSPKIKVTIRQSNGDQFEIEIESKALVKDLKVACKEKSGMEPEEMRLIHKGKILKDDGDQTIDQYNITDGMTVHLVKGKSANAGAAGAGAGASTTASTGAAGAGAAGAGAAGAGAAGADPFGGMGGMGGYPGGMGGFPGGMGGMGGYPGGMGGMGGMGGPGG
jgi:hypothetical protein